MGAPGRVVITGGAGYVGSLLTAHLLSRGRAVTVVDALVHGGDALLAFRPSPLFELIPADIRDEPSLAKLFQGADSVYHLAALVGFPACNRAGRDQTLSVNVDGTRNVFRAAREAGVGRLVFASSYSNYGAPAPGLVVTESSPLNPLSSYAESKIAAERYLLDQSPSGGPAVTCLRLATVFGVSPRTRFDLLVNQFCLQAYLDQTIVLYQQDFQRAFVHVQDVVRAMLLVADAPAETVAGEVFNVGSERLNSSKWELIGLIRERWPDLEVETRSLDFSGDMRSMVVSFEKIRTCLGFETTIDLRQGIAELYQALFERWIGDPSSPRLVDHSPMVV